MSAVVPTIPRAILQRFADFDITIVQQDRGVKLAIENAPADAFVDGKMIRGHPRAIVRGVAGSGIRPQRSRDRSLRSIHQRRHDRRGLPHSAQCPSDVAERADPNLVVCWGGHAIGRREYDYTKELGYQLGLRGLNICTGCGAGAMKGPMKGATIAHAKQRIENGRYLGITEPGIIAAESPNPIVNQLVIMPDMEKRLEAFVRVAHAIVIFPVVSGPLKSCCSCSAC